MVAPIDAKATIEAEGETFTLRLIFRTMAQCEAAGIDLFDPASLSRLTTVKTAKLVQCLAVVDHETMSDEEAFALTVRHGDQVTKALMHLIKTAAGKGGDEANPPKAGKGKTA